MTGIEHHLSTHAGPPGGRGVCTIVDALRFKASTSADSTAIVERGASTTYSELLQQAEAFARSLMSLGVAKGQRIAIYLPRSTDAVIAVFGTWMTGAVGVFINDVLKSRQVEYIVDHADAALIVSERPSSATLRACKIGERRIISVPDLKSGSAHADLPPLIAADLALLIYTSGSTGMPKGIMVTHENLLSGATIVSDYLHITRTDVLLSVLPFSFDYGLNQLLSSVLTGARIVLERSAFPADICRSLAAERVTGLAGVPMLWQQLAHPRSPFLKSAFPQLRFITNTGGKMPESVTRAIRRAHPHVSVYLMFGLTEAFRSTFLPPEQADVRPNSIGKAIPNVEILILDEQGGLCPPGQVGELVHRGANISLGYWKDPEATRRVFRPLPPYLSANRQEIAVYSGDYVRCDDEGYLYYIGRKDTQLKSHGMRVSPEEIEECLGRYDAITHVVAFGMPNERGESDIIVAFVPAQPALFSLEELKRFCKKELPEYLNPSDFLILESMPQTSSGKPDRVRIRDEHFSRTLRPQSPNSSDSSPTPHPR